MEKSRLNKTKVEECSKVKFSLDFYEYSGKINYLVFSAHKYITCLFGLHLEIGLHV